MKTKRSFHKEKILKFHQKMEEKETEDNNNKPECSLPESSSQEIENAFDEVILPKKRRIDDLYKKQNKKYRKDDNYIPYAPSDKHTEDGLAVNNFHKEATKVQLDLTGDSEDMFKKGVQMKKWDRKKKKMVAVVDKRAGKIKTESGVWIPATYKSNRYAQWKEKYKTSDGADDQEENASSSILFYINCLGTVFIFL